MDIAKLLESQNENDFKIGIILLAKKDDDEIVQILETVGSNFTGIAQDKIVRGLDKELPIQYRYLKSNNKIFFAGEFQLQYSTRGHFSNQDWKCLNLDS